MTRIFDLIRTSGTLVLLASLSGCSACTDTDTALLDPLDAGETDAFVGVGDGATCAPGLIACGAACVDPSADRLNCGRCGRACPGGESCVGGACVCPPGATCESGLGNPDDCGGVTCDALEVCIDASCQCRGGRIRVAGECLDLSTDPDNCGTPGNRCPDGSTCYGGECRGDCPEGTQDCDGACVRTAIDPANCGECGRRCDRDEFCARGSCEEYRGGIGCTTCPCDACTGDFTTCCPVAGPSELIACIDADRCP